MFSDSVLAYAGGVITAFFGLEVFQWHWPELLASVIIMVVVDAIWPRIHRHLRRSKKREYEAAKKAEATSTNMVDPLLGTFYRPTAEEIRERLRERRSELSAARIDLGGDHPHHSAFTRHLPPPAGF